ncbi:MAG: methylenetetrahydrofolate reductase [Pseudonocardiales bacterium]|nr:methylenetetrahydrofolate reductase [Pseudonocardiales bacterium]
MGVTRLEDYYADPGRVLSIEFWPPKTEIGERNLFAELERLRKLNPAFCSMTYGAGGSTRDKTVELVSRIEREFGLDMMCHLTVVGQSRAEVRAVLDQLRANDVRNIIALGWDGGGQFSVAVAGFPEVHPRATSRESDLRYLKAKVDAGAAVVITQLFFDNDDFYRFVDDARRIGIEVPIVPGMLPIRSAAQARRFTAMCGARIPAKLDALLATVEDDDAAAVQLGIDYTTEQCEQLLRFGVPGFHFYSLNRADALLEIHRRLGL